MTIIEFIKEALMTIGLCWILDKVLNLLYYIEGEKIVIIMNQ